MTNCLPLGLVTNVNSQNVSNNSYFFRFRKVYSKKTIYTIHIVHKIQLMQTFFFFFFQIIIMVKKLNRKC